MSEDSRSTEEELRRLRAELARWQTWVPPGHFYSPIPDPAAIARRADRIFFWPETTLPAIDMQVARQHEFAERFVKAYRDDYFPPEPVPGRRYYWRNPYFPFGDAFYVDRYLREMRPARVVEIGSGFSSAVMLDAADSMRAAGEQPPQLSFVEPYPDRLKSLLRPGDEQHCRLFEIEVQDAPDELFSSLEAGDLLLIDSSHVLKTGSDLSHLFFHVFPKLPKGILIFLHDIPWPFEYPRVWVDEGRAWNEAYALRLFLMYNEVFVLRWMPSFVIFGDLEGARSRARLLVEESGSGVWIERVR